MFRSKQKEQAGLPKEMQKLVPLLSMIPKTQMEKQFKRVWKKKTKCLDNPRNLKQIKKLQTTQTKKLCFEDLTVFTWLEKIMLEDPSKEHDKFIKWYKEEYYKISLKDLGIFK